MVVDDLARGDGHAAQGVACEVDGARFGGVGVRRARPAGGAREGGGSGWNGELIAEGREWIGGVVFAGEGFGGGD